MPLTLTINTSPPGVPAYIASMSALQSKRLTSVSNGNTTPISAWPSGARAYNVGNKIWFAFSGGAHDRSRARVYCHGGGHNDDWWNGLIYFDFNGSASPVGFVLVPNSYSNPGQEVAGADSYSDGKWCSVHSWDSMAIDEGLNIFVRNGGHKWSPSGSPTDRAWKFDLTANSLSSSISGDLGSSTDDESPCTGLHPTTHKVLWMGQGGRYRIYNASTHTFQTTTSQILANDAGATMAYAYSLGKALVHSASNWRQYNWDGNGDTVTGISPTMNGSLPAVGQGLMMAWDDTRQCVWAYQPASSNSTLYKIVPSSTSTWTGTAYTLTGTLPTVGDQNSHNYKRFGPLKDWDAIGCVADENGNAHVFKMPP